MGNLNEKLNALFTEVNKVCLVAKQDRKARESRGEYYNVFNTLGLQTDEVRLHSAFLAELLNPQGSHGVGDKFLKAFLKEIGLGEENYFDVSKRKTDLKVEKEQWIWIKGGTERGRIDIIVQDGTDAVIIENKIYAGDQENQLRKYSDYGEEQFLRNGGRFKLIYLTLDGHDPSEYSTGNEKIGKNLSYRDNITAWLTECAKIAFDRPLVRETINQYMQLIKQLTNMNMEDNYLNEVADIAAREENLDSTMAIIDAQSKISSKLRMRYIFEPLRKFATDNGYIEEGFRDEGQWPLICFKKPGWTCTITIQGQAQKSPGAWWKNVNIGVGSGKGKCEAIFKNKKLDCLSIPPRNPYRPYGEENVRPIDDWESPSSFKAIQSKEVVEWLIKKIKEIAAEIEDKGIGSYKPQ